MPGFRPLPPKVDLPALEHEVLGRWRDRRVFSRSLERTRGGPLWSVYEGPPTANGRPGTHHVEARVFKDLFPRYRTMKGWHVPRRAGWDCHGLPVELEVEKELGFTGKQDIEHYGVAEFNERCRQSVLRHVAEFERLTERIGFWVDFDGAYRTMDPGYVESVWWSLKRIFEAGLLVIDHRVTPYCPRCGTGLSDHEVAQGYLTVRDPSVYVRLPVTSGRLADLGAALLVWTTTPWTLISNTAVAVHPDVTYVAARRDGEVLVVAEPLLRAVLGDGAEVVDRFPGRALEHTGYRAPFALVDIPAAHYVGLADYVTVEDGTGLVHQAPAFGADDLAVARRYGLPVVNPVRADGRFDPALDLVGGLFFKAADRPIVADLERRGLLLRAGEYEHSYPHCWRCDTPLLYYALPSWFIRTTAIRDRLLAENERTDWHPETIKHGRYGDWLANNVDWALSRDRYWGTPLPIWRCPDDHLTCVGSLAELGELAGRDLTGLDPHRPYVDEVGFDCPRCGGAASRVPQVIDGWYDSGSMPFAQFGYPRQGAEAFTASYPAHFIAEALDQTRGWFYTLMAVGTLLFDRSSYRTVLCLGLIVDSDGRKMSKHLGNVLDPFELFDRHGADALRWLMLCVGNPWSTRRVGHELLDEAVRKVLLTYWNTAAFLVLYANAAGHDPGRPAAVAWSPSDAASAPAPGQRPLLDRWVLAELAATVAEVDTALDGFDPARAGRRLSDFLDDLSNWYVRRSRRRFWAGPGTPDGAAAFATLYECLATVTRLLAPFVPFITDYLWDVLAPPGAPDSVHLTDWPDGRPERLDPALSAGMALVRRLVELGRAARVTSGQRTRQPLAAALVRADGWAGLPAELRALLADELNVNEVTRLDGPDGAELTDYVVKPNFRVLGPRFGPRTRAVADAITGADPRRLAEGVRDGGRVTVAVDGGEEAVTAAELLVTQTPREGWAVATAAGETVALDVTLTPELRRAGLARELIRLVQDARKSGGLDVSDRIELWWQADRTPTGAELAVAVRGGAAGDGGDAHGGPAGDGGDAHGGAAGDGGDARGGPAGDGGDAHGGAALAAEVLAVRVVEGPPPAPLAPHRAESIGCTFWLRTVD